jgi:hypothetical protein
LLSIFNENIKSTNKNHLTELFKHARQIKHARHQPHTDCFGSNTSASQLLTTVTLSHHLDSANPNVAISTPHCHFTTSSPTATTTSTQQQMVVVSSANCDVHRKELKERWCGGPPSLVAPPTAGIYIVKFINLICKCNISIFFTSIRYCIFDCHNLPYNVTWYGAYENLILFHVIATATWVAAIAITVTATAIVI